MKRRNNTYAGTILTNDPSLAAWGWAVVDFGGRVIDSGIIKTESQAKKLRIRKGDDRIRRVSEIVQALLELINIYDVRMILSELPHGSQNAQAAMMVGMVGGVVQAMADCLGIPVEWYSEGDAKKALVGSRSATKEKIKNKVAKLYNITWTGPKYRDEAVADALAVYNVARQQSQMIKLLK